uniref:Fucolectin-3 n=1 Tax=Magallana gigas TaxID=29159 RepID=K1RFW8_MAGGI
MNETLWCEILLLPFTQRMNSSIGRDPWGGVLPNIALGKPAAQSSTQEDYNAAYAVDGNRGTDVLDNKCTHTGEGDRNPWWRVDLQAVYSITSVRILNRGINRYGGKCKK